MFISIDINSELAEAPIASTLAQKCFDITIQPAERFTAPITQIWKHGCGCCVSPETWLYNVDAGLPQQYIIMSAILHFLVMILLFTKTEKIHKNIIMFIIIVNYGRKQKSSELIADASREKASDIYKHKRKIVE